MYIKKNKKRKINLIQLRDQLTGKSIKSSTDNMRLANIDKWEIPKEQGQKNHMANLVALPESDSSSATPDSSQSLLRRD